MMMKQWRKAATNRLMDRPLALDLLHHDNDDVGDDDDDNYDDDHNHHVSASCSQSSHPFLLLPHFMSYLFFNPIQSDTLGKW